MANNISSSNNVPNSVNSSQANNTHNNEFDLNKLFSENAVLKTVTKDRAKQPNKKLPTRKASLLRLKEKKEETQKQKEELAELAKQEPVEEKVDEKPTLQKKPPVGGMGFGAIDLSKVNLKGAGKSALKPQKTDTTTQPQFNSLRNLKKTENGPNPILKPVLQQSLKPNLKPILKPEVKPSTQPRPVSTHDLKPQSGQPLKRPQSTMFPQTPLKDTLPENKEPSIQTPKPQKEEVVLGESHLQTRKELIKISEDHLIEQNKLEEEAEKTEQARSKILPKNELEVKESKQEIVDSKRDIFTIYRLKDVLQNKLGLLTYNETEAINQYYDARCKQLRDAGQNTKDIENFFENSLLKLNETPEKSSLYKLIKGLKEERLKKDNNGFKPFVLSDSSAQHKDLVFNENWICNKDDAFENEEYFQRTLLQKLEDSAEIFGAVKRTLSLEEQSRLDKFVKEKMEQNGISFAMPREEFKEKLKKLYQSLSSITEDSFCSELVKAIDPNIEQEVLFNLKSLQLTNAADLVEKKLKSLVLGKHSKYMYSIIVEKSKDCISSFAQKLSATHGKEFQQELDKFVQTIDYNSLVKEVNFEFNLELESNSVKDLESFLSMSAAKYLNNSNLIVDEIKHEAENYFQLSKTDLESSPEDFVKILENQIDNLNVKAEITKLLLALMKKKG